MKFNRHKYKIINLRNSMEWEMVIMLIGSDKSNNLGMRNWFYEERLKHLGMFNIEKKRLRRCLNVPQITNRMPCKKRAKNSPVTLNERRSTIALNFKKVNSECFFFNVCNNKRNLTVETIAKEDGRYPFRMCSSREQTTICHRWLNFDPCKAVA